METAAALHFFFPDRDIRSLWPLGKGNINETLQVVLSDGTSWVLQRLHPGVFADAGAIMANVRLVTRHLDREQSGSIRFFRLGTSPCGEDRFVDLEGCSWRILSFIEGSRTLEQVENAEQAQSIGHLLGRFHRLTAPLVPEQLADPLPGFHITPLYLERYDAQVQKSPMMDARERHCAALVERMRPLAAVLENARDRLSQGVIHGDPKVANFLFDHASNKAVSLVDLDTVKPGLLLHDLGDCLRSCCNPLGEGHGDTGVIAFVPELFTALMEGYIDQAGALLAPGDRELLVQSAAVISFELGLRFFTDHLAGDQYFKVEWPGQNLHRADIQLQLCGSILEQEERLKQDLRALLA
nr:aminoglycoside phosphotransferase family protein [uncultured Desulfobulbus sp.]